MSANPPLCLVAWLDRPAKLQERCHLEAAAIR
jgi:hypothetical protein